MPIHISTVDQGSGSSARKLGKVLFQLHPLPSGFLLARRNIPVHCA